MSNTVLEMVVGGSSKDKHSRPYPLCHMAMCTKARRPIQVQPFNLHTVLFLSLFLYYYSCNATHLTVKNQLINSAFIKMVNVPVALATFVNFDYPVWVRWFTCFQRLLNYLALRSFLCGRGWYCVFGLRVVCNELDIYACIVLLSYCCIVFMVYVITMNLG
jgi:hypothetical protein